MSWFQTPEHIEALKRHLSPVTVRDFLFYLIYKYELDEVDSMAVSSSIGLWRSIWRNRKIHKLYEKRRKKWRDHIAYVDREKVPGPEVTNTPKGKGKEDTTLVNWLADLQTWYGRYTNETFASVYDIPLAAVNEHRFGTSRILANERRNAISNSNASNDTLAIIDQHMKRKSEHSRKIRLKQAIEDRKNW